MQLTVQIELMLVFNPGMLQNILFLSQPLYKSLIAHKLVIDKQHLYISRSFQGRIFFRKCIRSTFKRRHHPPSSSFKMPSTTSKFTCPTQSASFAISDRNSSISLLAMAVPKPSLSISWLSEEGDAKIIPITSPRLLMTGPPLLPPFTLALIRYVLKGVGYGFSDAAMSPVVERRYSDRSPATRARKALSTLK